MLKSGRAPDYYEYHDDYWYEDISQDKTESKGKNIIPIQEDKPFLLPSLCQNLAFH